MKQPRLVLAVLVSAALTAALAPSAPAVSASDRQVAAKAPVAKRYVTYGQVGQVKARMTVDQAVATGEMVADTPGPCPGDVTRVRPKYPFNGKYNVYVGDDDRINEITVSSTAVRTPSGIGLGNTSNAVKKTYGSKLSGPIAAGQSQWGRFASIGTGANRIWIGFLFGEAYTYDGPMTGTDKVTFMSVSRGARPDLIGDSC